MPLSSVPSSSFPKEEDQAPTALAVAPHDSDGAPWLSRLRASGITPYISVTVSLLLIGAVALQLRGMAFGKIWEMVPRQPLFWLVFAAYYTAGPVSEWIIYRRLWRIPAAGIGALMLKMVSNELLLGYLGEVQFYAWARQRTQMTAAPFGAIKDVTILSALAGNGVTLALLALAWPMLGATEIGMETRTAILSLSVVLVSSILILLFRRQLFSLPRQDLLCVAGIQVLRVIAMLLLSAALWHLVLPQVPLGWWLILATLRMLVSRLPLIPNKDVVFAGLAVFLLGHDVPIAELMTMMAGLILATHVIVGAALAVQDLLPKRSAAHGQEVAA